MAIETSNHFGIIIFFLSTKNDLRNCHPVIKKSNKPNKNISINLIYLNSVGNESRV